MQNQAREEELEKEDGEQDWIEHTNAKEVINRGSTTKVPIASLSKDQPKYYVDILRIPIIINHAYVIKSENMVENLAQPSLDEIIKLKISKSSTQMALTHVYHGLLSLPDMLVRRTNGKEPLANYSQSYVVTSEKYLKIMRQKAMDREDVDYIWENRRKENQANKQEKRLIMLTTFEKLAKREQTTNQFHCNLVIFNN